MNWENEKVRREVYDMMDFWCQKGIDGFRMDVISMISKVEGLPDGELKANGYGDFSPYVHSGPKVHDYLQEMNREVLSKYDLLTVGECPGVTPEKACQYADLSGKELSMVFQFEHMDLDGGETFKWNDRKISLPALKAVLGKWQKDLHNKAWNSLYWCNHDQPRMISRLGDDGEYREVSAKMLATCLHFHQGTPYIYQGEELAMTNAPFETLDDFRDIESINAYHEFVDTGKIAHDDMMRYLRYKGRDNARTPMQWDDSENAGFTTGTPWIMVNPNYKEVNAKEQTSRENSVFHYYQKLIKLRKEEDIITEGSFELYLPEDENLYVYTRTFENQKILVVCNFAKEEMTFKLPIKLEGSKEILIQNYEARKKEDLDEEVLALKPFEAFAVKLG